MAQQWEPAPPFGSGPTERVLGLVHSFALTLPLFPRGQFEPQNPKHKGKKVVDCSLAILALLERLALASHGRPATAAHAVQSFLVLALNEPLRVSVPKKNRKPGKREQECLEA